MRRASWAETIGGLGPDYPPFIAALKASAPPGYAPECVALPDDRGGWLVGVTLTRAKGAV